MMRIPVPAMAVSDGSTGFAKAARHVAGRQDTALHREPPNESQDENAMRRWLIDYMQWCADWNEFLKEFMAKNGRRIYTRERLRRPGEAQSPGEGGSAFHLHRDAEGAWRPVGLHHQLGREPRCAAKGDAQAASGLAAATSREGRHVVVLHAHRRAQESDGDPALRAER